MPISKLLRSLSLIVLATCPLPRFLEARAQESTPPQSAAAPTQTQPRKALIFWEGVPEALYYELQFSSDPLFKRNATRMGIKKLDDWVPLKTRPAHARIRPIFADKVAGNWHRLETRPWQPPKVERIVSVPQPSEGFKLRWSAPANAGNSDLTYRIRLSKLDGTTLYEAWTEEQLFRLPALPGGDFDFEIEPIGDHAQGAIHFGGEGIFTVRVQTDPVPFDPEKENSTPASHDLTSLSDLYFHGFSLRSELHYASREDSAQLVANLDARITGASGFQVQFSVPFALRDSGGEAPRVGGGPYPSFSLAKRLWSLESNYLGAGARLDTAIDSSEVRAPAQARGALFLEGRWAFSKWMLDGRVLWGSRGTWDLLAEPVYFFAPKLHLGISGGIERNTFGHAGGVGPFARYLLSDSAYLTGRVELGIGSSLARATRSELGAGIVWLF